MEPLFYRNPYNYYAPNNFRFAPYRNNRYYSYAKNLKNEEKEETPPQDNSSISEENSRGISFDKPIFEIFGIKLFFDDILLISLIFFLYNEGVKDQSLFISLILLLLS